MTTVQFFGCLVLQALGAGLEVEVRSDKNESVEIVLRDMSLHTPLNVGRRLAYIEIQHARDPVAFSRFIFQEMHEELGRLG